MDNNGNQQLTTIKYTNPNLNNQNNESNNDNGGSSIVFIFLCIGIIVGSALFFVSTLNREKEDLIDPSEMNTTTTSTTTTTTVKTSSLAEIELSKAESIFNKTPKKSFLADSMNSSNANKTKCTKTLMHKDETTEELDCEEYYAKVVHNGLTYTTEGDKYIITAKNVYLEREVYPKGENVVKVLMTEITVHGYGVFRVSHGIKREYLEERGAYPTYKIIFEKVNDEYVWKSTEVIKKINPVTKVEIN